jgi:hypothetical protein
LATARQQRLETEQAAINRTGNSAGEAGHHTSVAHQADEAGSTFDTAGETGKTRNHASDDSAHKTGNYQANPTYKTGDQAGPTLDSTSETRKAGNNATIAETNEAGARCANHTASQTGSTGHAAVARSNEAATQTRSANNTTSQTRSTSNAAVARTHKAATETRSTNGTAGEACTDKAKTGPF